jgi:hypothetical protein
MKIYYLYGWNLQAISVILQKFRLFRKHAAAGERHLFTLTSFGNTNIIVSVKMKL